MASSITLDAIINSAIFFVAKWSPALKRNQSRDVLRLVVNKMYGSSRGSLFHAHVRCSHAALADSLSLSREWVCTLIGRLRDVGWITTEARRLPDGKQEITLFRPGKMLKRLLVMLLKSKQRHTKYRVKDQSQVIPPFPNKTQVKKNLEFLAALRQSLSEKMGLSGRSRTIKRW